jgi:uncharacterized protein (TIGR02271 family)
MIDQGSVPSLMGSTVRDSTGDKIGKVGQVYLDDTTGQPEWVTVRTGLFGTRESFVPLAAARVEGDELVVDVPKDRVTGAPKIDEDGHLSEEQEAELYSYYGVSPGAFGQDTGPTEGYGTTDTGYAAGTTDTGYAAGTTTDTADAGAGYGADGGTDGGAPYASAGYDADAGADGGADAGAADAGADGGAVVGRDTSGPSTDEAMTRSEEQLRAGTERVEAGRARLRKYVVTEEQQVQVPVSREEVRLEREPITEANREAAYSGGDITEEEHEVTLHEERPVVQTEAVPVERVRLDKETVTDTETVSGEVRKEQIDVDDDSGRLRDR